MRFQDVRTFCYKNTCTYRKSSFCSFKCTRNMTRSYCVRCRKMTASTHEIRAVSKNKRRMVRGRCKTCKATKTRFVKQKGDLVSSSNAITGRVKLPWSKFKGEMHLPGHNFTGPGTNLTKRLNADGTPKTWSKPVNRVDIHTSTFDRACQSWTRYATHWLY